MYRKGIDQESFVKRFQWLYYEIKARNAELSLKNKPTMKLIMSYVNYISDFIENKKEILGPSLIAKSNQQSILMLCYYRNNLAHLFINEGEIGCALIGMSNIVDI